MAGKTYCTTHLKSSEFRFICSPTRVPGLKLGHIRARRLHQASNEAINIFVAAPIVISSAASCFVVGLYKERPSSPLIWPSYLLASFSRATPFVISFYLSYKIDTPRCDFPVVVSYSQYLQHLSLLLYSFDRFTSALDSRLLPARPSYFLIRIS
ncbi:hypothetical protein VTL71DRAFT_7448 [Oculimacula yallundae]|uniref:Uncharacterized protein n=1 Tax=Oculimacula yallundae TaxID=86028 RepID=A0ABR4BU47_9HELO